MSFMDLKPFVPNDSDLTSADAFRDAVERQFGERFFDINKTEFEISNEWEELFRQYIEMTDPNNIVEISCLTDKAQGDLSFNIVGQNLTISDNSDPDFHQFPKRKMKPKPLD